jgi:hypothetical protein
MHGKKRLAVLAASAIASCVLISTARASGDWGFYDVNGAGANSTSITHFAEQVTVGGPAPAIIHGMQIGLNFLDHPSSAQSMDIQIYTGANLSPTATNALAGATLIEDTGSFNLLSPGLSDPVPGAFNEVLNFDPTPIVVPTDTFTVVFSLLNNAGTAPTTDLGGIFNSLTPTAGTSPGFVWTDNNSDGVFQGSEQSSTVGGGSIANIDLSISVPEPASAGLLLATSGMALLRRRRRA